MKELNALRHKRGRLRQRGDSWHIAYLSIPVYYGYNFGKLNVNIGLQTSLLLYSTIQSITKIPYMGIDQTYFSKGKLPIKRGDFGTRINLFYPLSNRFSMEITYYYGLINTYRYTSQPVFTYRTQQITFGFRYSFLSSRKNENKK